MDPTDRSIPPVMMMGNEDQKRRFLGIFKGTKEPHWGAFAMSEPGAGSDVAATKTIARRDGVDYVPTRPEVLFGHHFASITGLAPMLGPAVAVIWGWAPPLIWVVIGAVLVGCVHDFGALVVSVRARGQSIGKVAEGIVGRRAKTLFHLIIFFGIALAITSGALGLLHALAPDAHHVTELAVLVGANLVATVMRFVLLRGWVFHPGRNREEGTSR